MPSKEDLHRLIDSLPEGAVDNVHRMLQHMQTWPPQPPPGLMGRGGGGGGGGVAGSFGGGGMWRRTPEGKIANGRFHRGRPVPDGFLNETLHIIDGRQLEIQERVRPSADNSEITYTIRVLTGKSEWKEEFLILHKDLPEVSEPEE